jgi:hypothetical protein
MSIVDKVIAAVTPPESDEARAEARAKARAAAVPGSWLSMVLDHHLQIESAFQAVASATSVSDRLTAQKRLALILTGHSVAEEAVLYPAMALTNQKGHSEIAYVEQSAAKVQLAALETLDPMSQDFIDKLEHIRGAVAHHVYEEESKWFPELQANTAPAAEAKLASRYQEKFERYLQIGLPRDAAPRQMAMSTSVP